ncbi:MAG TPA: epimerase [Arthrobacter bacterium]|nr:epimerase [Arthrobacter sp.]
MTTTQETAVPKNPIGVHAGVWVGDWSPDSARYAISESAKAGFDLIEIPAVDPSSVDITHTTRLLAEHGIQAAFSLALGKDADINSEDADRVARGERLLENAVYQARDAGAHYVGGVLYSQMGKYDLPFSARGRANSLAVLGRVAAKAKAARIALGLEYVNRYESNLLNTAEQTVAFIRELGADNVRLHLDTFHANLEESDLATPVETAGDLLAYIHAGESHRGYLGSGSIEWPTLFRALHRADFTGPVTFESFSGTVLPRAVSDDIGLWRDPWANPVPVARHARAFIATQLEAAEQAVAPTLATRS